MASCQRCRYATVVSAERVAILKELLADYSLVLKNMESELVILRGATQRPIAGAEGIIASSLLNIRSILNCLK